MLKTINIIATAAFPWRTGTAILALFRAFYLAEKGLDVILYIPWLIPAEQALLFEKNLSFTSPEQQEAYIRAYLPQSETSLLQIEFYPATYNASFGSILPTCQLSKIIRYCDWLILEEPEHLNWKHPWNQFKKQASRVTGIVLTNYPYYCQQAFPRIPFFSWLLKYYNQWLITHHCDDVILLGSALAYLPHAQQINSSGIHPSFFTTRPIKPHSKTIYFIGKLIWEKGFCELIDYLSHTETQAIDVYGTGKDQKAIADYAQEYNLSLNFKGTSVDPAHDLKDYKIFINTSRSETVCTTTAEALGQGKFVIIPEIPGNDAFYPFKNCLTYSSPKEFEEQLKFALKNIPEIDEQIQSLTWDAAIDRLLQYYQYGDNTND